MGSTVVAQGLSCSWGMQEEDSLPLSHLTHLLKKLFFWTANALWHVNNLRKKSLLLHLKLNTKTEAAPILLESAFWKHHFTQIQSSRGTSGSCSESLKVYSLHPGGPRRNRAHCCQLHSQQALLQEASSASFICLHLSIPTHHSQ